MTSHSRDIWLLSIAFMLMFLGYDGVQQYVTTYFAGRDQAPLGFQVLMLIYVSYAVGGPLAATMVTKLGAKRSMITAAPAYTLFMIGVLSSSAAAVYAAAVLVGLAASVLWTAQGTHFVRAASARNLGADSGVFNTLNALGPALGVVLVGAGIATISYTPTFLIAGLCPVVAIIFFALLTDMRANAIANTSKPNRFRAFGSPTARRLSGIWFAFWLLFGLSLGTIPIQVTRAVGTAWSGPVLSLTFVVPILMSYPVGRLSDGGSRQLMLALAAATALVGQVILFVATSAVPVTAGVICVSLSFAILATVTLALLGDLTDDSNVESLSAFFTTTKTMGVLVALLIADVLQSKTTYLIGAAAILGITALVAPAMRGGLDATRDRISRELR